MNNHNHLIKRTEEKAKRREKKKAKKMRVSGKKVLELKEIITKKSQN